MPNQTALTTLPAEPAKPAQKRTPVRAKAPAQRRAAPKSSRPASDKRVSIADIAPAKKKAAKPAAKPASAAMNKKADAAVVEAKVVRDGFTMPRADYDKIKSLKALCLKSGVAVKKSELLRAGLYALEALNTQDLLLRIQALAPIKAGRKKKD